MDRDITREERLSTRGDCAQQSPNGIGFAIDLLQKGFKVSRKGWNGKGMHLKLQIPDSHSKMSLSYIYMKTADNNLIPWIASQSDLLANDWLVLRE